MALDVLLILAGLAPTEISAVPPVTTPTPPAIAQQPDYVSELPRSGMTAEMFERPFKAEANLVSLFSTNDYPIEAVRNLQEGTVAVVLRVSKNGQVLDCIVERSSGVPALDSQTCRILWMRARFQPARDKAGRPVESASRQRVRWQLPDPDPVPFAPWAVRMTLDFVQDGGVVSCKVESSGAIQADQDDCGLLLMYSDGLARLRADANYPRQRSVMETQFSPNTTIPDAKAPKGMHLFARQVARLTIDESGKPMRCRVIEIEGPHPPIEGCDELLHGRYQEPGIKIGAIEATMARNLYLPD